MLDTVKDLLAHQLEAALCTLGTCLDRCPDPQWNAPIANLALAFLVSGGVVSIWGAMAIFPVLRMKPFLLYLVLALTGSLLAGWAYGSLA